MAIMQENSDVDLNLWKRSLGCVPDWVWQRTELETLILADNGVREISERIGGLQRLRMLDLGHNELTRCAGADLRHGWAGRAADDG
jgi:Leucine-rich repeat (LRR) protein